MSEYGTEVGTSDRSESDEAITSDEAPQKLRTNSAKRAMKLANEKLHRSNCHKYPVGRFGYNKYMAHHYLYMVKVAEVCKIESYAEAS